MPRLSIFRPNPRNRLEGWNEPFDYCRRDYPQNLAVAQARTNAYHMDIDLNVEHPDYNDDVFCCESCGRQLGTADN